MSSFARPDGFGPPISGGKPRDGGPDWLKLSFIVGCTGMAVVLVIGTLNLAVLWQGVGSVDRVPLATGLEIPVATDAAPDFTPIDIEPVTERTTVLLVGSDSREGLTDDELLAIGTEDHGSDLTDTIILLQIDPEADALRMVSFPRDLWVELCDGGQARINAAFARGESALGDGLGAACLVTTVEQLAGVGIDHYIRVDFAGFVQAVDAVGGVTFHVDEPLQDRAAGLDIPAGCVTFDGIRAIQFVRARNLDSDLGRVARQQRFMAELVDEIASLGTLTNPARLQRLVGSIAGSLQTDEDLGAAEMARLAAGLRGLSGDHVESATVPVADQRMGGQAVLVPIEAEAEALFATFRATPDEPVDAAPSPPEPVPGQDPGTPADPPPAVDASADDGPRFAGAVRSDVTC